MAQPRFVQRLVGVGQIHPPVNHSRHQRPRAGLMPLVLEQRVLRLAPHIPLAMREWLAAEIVVSQHAERRDDVLPKVFVLVIAPDDHEIGVESVQFLPDAAKAGYQAGAVFQRSGVPLVLAVLNPHRFRPVAGVFQLLGNVRIAPQRAPERDRLVRVGRNQRRVVSQPQSQNLCHSVTSWHQPCRRRECDGGIVRCRLRRCQPMIIAP